MTRQIERVLVVGSGVMGRGIAASFAASGFDSEILSRDPDRLAGALPAGVSVVGEPPLETPDLIVESIPEDLDLKKDLFRRLDATYQGRTILASNTSCLPLDELSAVVGHRDRFCGLHYFQPAESFEFVELIRIAETADDVVEAVTGALSRAGKRPILLNKPVIGFLINRLQHALIHEAYHLMEGGVVDAATVDLVLKNLMGPRMSVTGIFEQKDLSGVDTHALAQLAVVPHLHHGAEPSRICQDLHTKGDLGVKTGRGFYDWRDRDVDAVHKANADKLARILAIVRE